MIYILDTDILSLLAHKDSPQAPRIRRHIAELPTEHSVVTTIINFEEQIRGWMAALARAKSPQTEVMVYQRLLHHLQTFRAMTVLPYDDDAAAILRDLRGLRLATMDLKIAAIALATNAVLVTRNAIDFRRVPSLHIEDWSKVD